MSQTLFSREATEKALVGFEKMPAGTIQTDCTLQKLEYKGDTDVVIMAFKNKKGQTISKWLDDSNPMQFTDRETGEKEPEETARIRVQKDNVAFLHYIGDLLDSKLVDAAYAEGKGYNGLVRKFVKGINEILPTLPVTFNLKIIATGTGNPTLAYRVKQAIEIYVEGESTNLQLTTKDLRGLNNPTNKTDSAIMKEASDLI